MVFAEQFIYRLQEIGLQEYILPLLLVFVILYGVLESISVFNNNKIDAAISIIGALMVVTYTPFVEGVFQAYVVNLFGSISLILLAILAFLMLSGMVFGESVQYKLKRWQNTIMILAALAVFFMFLSYGGSQMLGLGAEYITEGDLIFVVVLLGIIGFMGWVVQGEGKTKSGVKYALRQPNGEIISTHDKYQEAVNEQKNDDQYINKVRR